MEGKELYNCSLSSLVTNSFAVQWSQDNHLSIIAEKGIHVFEAVPSPMTYGPSVRFSRSFIYPSEILPTEAFTSKVNLVLWHWKKEEIYSFLMEEVLMPRVNVVADLVPKVVSLAWSSQGMVHPGRCLLAMVSSAGAVDILLKNDNEWFSACDIHTHWLRIVDQDFPENFSSQSSEELKYHIRRLQAVAITWSNLISSLDNSYSYFVVAYRSSDLLIWKIPSVIDHSQEVFPTVTLRTKLNTSVKVDVMKWIIINRNKHLIVMGLFNGQILGLIVEESQGSVSPKQIQIYPEEDLVRISDIKFILQSEKEILLIISKSSFLFIITIDDNGQLLRDLCFRVPAFSITGVSIINKDEFFVFSQDGKLFLTKIENEEITGKIITTDLPESYCQFLGLAHSYNQVLFATVTSPNFMYDHLVVREPSTLHIFCLNDPRFNPLEILRGSGINSLSNSWDCLMAVGLKLFKSLIPLDSINKIPDNFETFPIYKLRVLMWLLTLADVHKRKKCMFDFSNISDELLEIRSLISIYTASSYLISITEKAQITTEQRLCARFLRAYLQIYIAGEDDEADGETPVCRNADRALKISCKIEQFGSEMCNLCKKMITDFPWKTEKCPSGHKLPRCAVTLLQITSDKFRTCPICKQIFHSCLDEEYPDGPKCLFCDVPALHDNRVYGSVDKERKNFSLRRLSRVRNSEQEDGAEEDPDY